ncbi:MAG: STAS domain-containing protein [Sedimentisphaerales bacterium]|nr:STAS domain-containing protein [Sedimentisphaerales bacterium]
MEPKEPRVKIEYGTEVTIATFADESILEDAQIKRLEQALLPAVTKNEEKRLILNFENVRFMSSAFLGLLVKVHKHVIEAGGHLQLYNLDPKIYKVFEITQLTKIFDIVLSES